MFKLDHKKDSFVQIIPTIEYLLTGKGKNHLKNSYLKNKRYNKVVLVLVDGLGWCFWEKYKNKNRFNKKEQIVLKLQAQFPSTTTAQITTILTGQPVYIHGMYEWRYFEPEADDIIIPFKFSRSDSKKINSLKNIITDPRIIFSGDNFYERFRKNGIEPYYFIKRIYEKSPFNRIVCKGVNFIETDSWENSIEKLSCIIQKKEKAYYFLYIDELDAKGHEFGPDSDNFRIEIRESFQKINKLIDSLSKEKNTLIIVTADHGLSFIDPKTTIYLNKIMPNIWRYLKRNKKGKIMAPAGGPRDMFLYVKEDCLDELKNKLQMVLADKAKVFKTEELLIKNVFGSGKPSQKFIGRLGNLIILPNENESVWWYKKNVFEQKYYGHHGGLTKKEMEIPLILIPTE